MRIPTDSCVVDPRSITAAAGSSESVFRIHLLELRQSFVDTIHDFSSTRPVVNTDTWLDSVKERNPLRRIGTVHPVNADISLLLRNFFYEPGVR